MTIAQMMLMEIEQEALATRKCLERLPEDRLDWKPAGKSMTLGQLAYHIAAAPGGLAQALSADEMQLPEFGAPLPENKAQVLAAFEASLATLRETLGGWSDEFMMADWTVKKGEQVLVAQPRMGWVRMLVISHIIHHRGQLSVYLRQLDVPLPSIYGPSADELPDFLTEAAAAG